MLNAMNLLTVALQRASLRETLFTKETFVRSYSCVRSCVSFEIKRIVETLSAERTEIALHVAMTFHVTIEKSLETEGFTAHAAGETIGIVFLLSEKSRFCSNGILKFHDIFTI